MLAYILRRLLLIIPTLLGIMVINFTVIQFAPGGPVEQVLAEMRGNAVDSTAAFSGQAGDIKNSGQGGGSLQTGTASTYRGAQGLDPAIIKEIEQQFGLSGSFLCSGIMLDSILEVAISGMRLFSI
jgi:microcin C transport system permease protein